MALLRHFISLCLQADSYQLLCRTHQLDCPLGIPGLSIPAGLGTDDMPVGIMFYARTGKLAALSWHGFVMLLWLLTPYITSRRRDDLAPATTTYLQRDVQTACLLLW